MALMDNTNGTGTTMLVQPAYSGYNMGCNNGGGLFSGNGNDWIGILFLIALCSGGFGNYGGFGRTGGAGAGAMDNYVLTSDFSQLSKQISDSYSMTERKLDGISNGLCDGFYTQAQLVAGVNSNIANAQYNLANAITTNGYETRIGINGVNNQIASCCCDLRSDISNVNYNNAMNTNAIQQAVANGFCQTNFNSSNNTRDIITSTHGDTDRIIARIDAMESARQAEKIAELQAENQSLRFAASQQAQNAYLVSQLGQQCPKPAYVVQPPQQVTFPTNCCGGVNYAASGCSCA